MVGYLPNQNPEWNPSPLVASEAHFFLKSDGRCITMVGGYVVEWGSTLRAAYRWCIYQGVENQELEYPSKGE